MPAYRVFAKRLVLNTGTEFVPPSTGVVVFVGANNVGKSRALRDIANLASGVRPPDLQHHVFPEGAFDSEGTEADFLAWADATFDPREQVPGINQSFGQVRGALQQAFAQSWAVIGPFSSKSVVLLDGHGRLGIDTTASHYDLDNEIPTHPLHILWKSGALQRRLSDVAEDAFKMPVMLDEAGSRLHLRWGRAEPTGTIDERRATMRAIPMVAEQGDGVRSFIGVMLTLLTNQFHVVLVDEPEAFLHPPQARKLGRNLGEMASTDAQLFVATHSADVLRGLLEGGKQNVTVVRLTRDGEHNPAAVLTPDDIRDLWNDPALMYSDVLNGLFHTGVVVCEGYPDSRFYDAAYNALTDHPVQDLLFIPSAGKQAIAKIVRALRKVDVPVAAVADFDVLRSRDELKAIVDALDGDFTALEKDWMILDGALTTKPNGWQEAKESGVATVPRNDAYNACIRLCDALAELGLHVVPVGALEGWDRGLGVRKGPEWTPAAISADAHVAESVQRFVKQATRALEG